MKPIGMIPCFFAARSSRLRARSRASSLSNTTWLKRASAFRTCDASWIGSRRRPLESMYANALSGSWARSFARSGGMLLMKQVARLAHRYRQRRQVIHVPDAHVRQGLHVALSGRVRLDPGVDRGVRIDTRLGIVNHCRRQVTVNPVQVVAQRGARECLPAVVARQLHDAVAQPV